MREMTWQLLKISLIYWEIPSFIDDAFYLASAIGDATLVQALLQNQANVDSWIGGDTSLLFKQVEGQGEIMTMDRRKEARISAENDGHDALMAATFGGHERVVQILLAAGADVNQEGGYYGNALQVAAFVGSENIVRFLLEKGSNANQPGEYYGSALQAAIKGGSNAPPTIPQQGEFTTHRIRVCVMKENLPQYFFFLIVKQMLNQTTKQVVTDG